MAPLFPPCNATPHTPHSPLLLSAFPVLSQTPLCTFVCKPVYQC